MSDLIDRQAAIDAIKTWGLIDSLAEGQAIEILADEEKLPTAQPDVIRCKDCKYYKTKFCALDTWTNEITIYNAQPDDFCSKVERKTDE